MNWNPMFFLKSILLGLGLAVDAFLISLSNGMNTQSTKRGKICLIAALFASFQFCAPLIGWACVYFISTRFLIFSEYISLLAFVALCFLGIRMIVSCLRKNRTEEKLEAGIGALIVQALVTSLDALSVGFAIEGTFIMALVCSAVMAVITFAAYLFGFFLGRRFGTKFSDKAQIIGGVILILIGLEIFVSWLI